MSTEFPQMQDISVDRAAQLYTFLIGLQFTPPFALPLYHLALTHSSYTYENRMSHLDNYERLEFLGDAVLKIVVSEYLYDRFPQYREGELTKIRAVIVSDTQLAGLARHINIGQCLIFGASEAKAGGIRKASNLACGLEALLGALFLDGKMPEVRQFLTRHLEAEITRVDLDKVKDNFKAVLQEMTQAQGIGLPDYKTIEETGPAHNKRFVVEVFIHDESVGLGTGKTKKEAQQNAAKEAMGVFANTINAVMTSTEMQPANEDEMTPLPEKS